MCPPLLAAIPAIVSAIGSAASAMGAAGAATTAFLGSGWGLALQAGVGFGTAIMQHQAQARAYKENAEAALKTNQDDVEALAARQDQINRSASNDILANEIAAIQERGAVRASATGLATTSLGEVLQGVNAQRDRARTNIIYNRDTAGQQTKRDMSAARSTAQSRISSVSRPSLTALGFKLASVAADVGTTRDSLRNRGNPS